MNHLSPTPHGRMMTAVLLVLLGLAGCNGDGRSTGTVTLAITDAPSDELAALTVTIESAVLIGEAGHQPIPLPDDAPITLNLLELDGINQILAVASIPAGSYSKLRLSIRDASVTWIGVTEPEPVTIVANGKVDLNLQGPVEIADGGATTIQLDFSAEDSLKLTETGDGKLILRPQIFVTGGLTADHPDNPPIDDVAGLIASVDADTRSFVLRTFDGPRLTVIVTDATRLVSHDGEASFADLHPDLRVHVEGSLDAQGRLVATAVHLAPGQLAEVGVVSNLDALAGTFTLKHPDRDPTPVRLQPGTLVLFHGSLLTAADLANGQVVRIGGRFDTEEVLHAHVIRIRGDRFSGTVIDLTGCAADQTLVVKIGPRRMPARLALAGVVLPNDTILASGRDLPCPLLHEGSPVRVWGRLAPDSSAPGGIRFLAARIVILPGHVFTGLASAVESAEDPTVGTFLLTVDADALSTGTLRVHVAADTLFEPGLSFGTELEGIRVAVQGRFERTVTGVRYTAISVRRAPE